MNRTHEDLPKFSGEFDTDYLAVKPFLEDIWTEAVRAVQARMDLGTPAPQEATGESPEGMVQLWPYPEMEQYVKTEIEYAPFPLILYCKLPPVAFGC